MKKILTIIGLAAAASLAGAQAQTLIGYWNFNGLSITTASAPGSGGVPNSIASDSGTGATLTLSGAWSGLVDDFGGSTTNALNSDIAGASLSLVSNVGNGSYIQFSFSMTSLNGVSISFATRGTSTGFNAGQWSYSTNGTSFTDFGSNTATTSTSFALASPGTTTGLDNAATAFLRYTLDGASSVSGNNRIDNLQITAVPEPSTWALIGIGAFVMIWNLRRRRALKA